MNKMILTLAAALALTVSCAPAEPALVVASDTTFPPMEFMSETQEIVGFDIDLIKAVAEAGKFKIVNKSVGWDGIFTGLTNGNYDIVASSVTITEERTKTMDFSTPYINAGQAIVVPSASTVTSLKDLVGKKVGVQVSTTGDMEVAKVPEIERKAYEDATLLFEEIVNGRVDAVVIDGPVASLFVKNPRFVGKIKIVGEPLTNEFFGFAVKKGNTELLAKINAGLAAVKADGTLDKLVAKWLK